MTDDDRLNVRANAHSHGTSFDSCNIPKTSPAPNQTQCASLCIWRIVYGIQRMVYRLRLEQKHEHRHSQLRVFLSLSHAISRHPDPVTLLNQQQRTKT